MGDQSVHMFSLKVCFEQIKRAKRFILWNYSIEIGDKTRFYWLRIQGVIVKPLMIIKNMSFLWVNTNLCVLSNSKFLKWGRFEFKKGEENIG